MFSARLAANLKQAFLGQRERGAQMAITITQLLKLPIMDKAELAAGAAGGGNVINGFSLIEEVFPCEGRAQKDVVILSSIRGISDSCQDFDQLLGECRRKRISALFVKKSAESDVLPPGLLLAADRLGFPVVLLPQNLPFSLLINTVTYNLLREEGYDKSWSFEENCLQEILFNTKDPEAVSRKAYMLGIRVDSRLGLFFIQLHDAAHLEEVRQYCVQKWKRKCYTSVRNSSLIVIVELKMLGDEKAYLTGLAQELLGELGTAFPEDRVYLGIGRCYENILNLKRSFYEARAAMIMSILEESGNTAIHYDDLGIYKILLLQKNKKELFQFYRETIGRVEAYDQENHTEYLDTIKAYTACGFSIDQTAQRLHIHYNTARNRLLRINSIFHIDLYNCEQCVEIFLAVKIADFLARDKNIPTNRTADETAV